MLPSIHPSVETFHALRLHSKHQISTSQSFGRLRETFRVMHFPKDAKLEASKPQMADSGARPKCPPPDPPELTDSGADHKAVPPSTGRCNAYEESRFPDRPHPEQLIADPPRTIHREGCNLRKQCPLDSGSLPNSPSTGTTYSLQAENRRSAT